MICMTSAKRDWSDIWERSPGGGGGDNGDGEFYGASDGGDRDNSYSDGGHGDIDGGDDGHGGGADSDCRDTRENRMNIEKE